MNFRRFPLQTEEIARFWRDAAFSAQKWNVVGEVGAGESEALVVENEAGLRAVAKPALGADGKAFRGAHEKIASDLAFELGIPVPPVILWRDGPGAGGERLHSLSLWGGFRQFEYWNVAAGYGLIDERVCKGVSGAVTAIGLFHEWISAHDRKPEHFLLISKRARTRWVSPWWITHSQCRHIGSGPMIGIGLAPSSWRGYPRTRLRSKWLSER